MALTKWKQIDGDLTGSRVLTGSLELSGSLNIQGSISASSSITGSDVYIDGFGSISSSLETISSSAASVPTFQQVTDQGATTTNSIGIGATTVNYNLTSYASGNGNIFPIVAGVGAGVNKFVGLGLSNYIAQNGSVKGGFVLERINSYGTGKIHILNNNDLDNTDADLTDAKLTIDESGNVGIGTTTPTQTLDVNGNAQFGSTIFIGDTNGKIVNGGGNFTFNNRYAGSLILATSDTERLRIDSIGNVGIGTTTPSYKLDVSGSGNFTNGLTVTGSIFHDGDLTVSGIVTAEEFHTEFVSASIIYRSGSTKFGDTLDDTHQFTGSLYISSSYSQINTIDGGNLKINGTNGTNGYLYVNRISYASNSSNTGLWYPDNRSFVIQRATEGVTAAFTQDGKVGIGTTSPSHTLDVSGSGVITNGLDVTGSLNVSGSVVATSTGSFSHITGDKIYIDNTLDGHQIGKLIIDYQSDNSPTLRADGGEFIRFNSDIVLGSSTNNIHASANHSADLKFIHERSGNFGFLFSTEDSGSVFRIDGSGNVGIGTTSPSYNLDVASDGNTTARITSAGTGATQLRFENTGTGFLSALVTDNSGILRLDATGIKLNAPTTASIISASSGVTSSDVHIDDWGSVSASLASITANDLDGSGTANYVPKWSDSDTLTDSVIYDDGTNVGINTSSPGELLTVNLGSDGDALSLTHAGSNALKIERSGTNDTKIRQYRQFDSKIMIETIADGNNQTGLNVVGQGSGNSSYVGIGTDAPSYKLDVSGSGNFTDNLTVTGSGGNTFQTYHDSSNNGSGIKLTRTTDGFEGRIYFNSTYNFPDNSGNFRFGSSNSQKFSGNSSAIEQRNSSPTFTWISNTNSGKGFYLQAPASDDSLQIYLHDNYNQQNVRKVLSFSNDSNFTIHKSGSSDSLLYVSQSGNVGIGTSTPVRALDIDGYIRLRNQRGILFANIDGNEGRVKIIGDENGDFIQMNVDNSNSHLVKLTTSGFGIGTTSPTEKLTVEGNISGSGTLTVGGQYIYGDTTTPFIRLSNSAGAELAYGTSKVSIGGPTHYHRLRYRCDEV